MTTAELKPFQDKTVRIETADREILTAKLLFVDLEYQDIIVDVLETSQPEHYRDKNACYTIPAAEVLAIKVTELP